MKKNVISWVFFCVCLFGYGQKEYKVAFYNVLNYPLEDRPINRSQYLNIILDEMAPDIFTACEINNEDGARDILSILRNTVTATFQMAPFIENTSDDNITDENELQNIMYYNSELFVLDAQTTITTDYRDFNRYRLKLKESDETNPIYLEVIVCHLKSSSGSDNENLRKAMVDDLELFLESLPVDSFVVLAGDFNIYDSDEPAFVELTDDTNNITFLDPAGRVGDWHNNESFLDVFTQSTRRFSGMGGASGGFDDRFDFIMTSTTLTSDLALNYVPDSYTTFGNNKNPNCYNESINSIACAGDEFGFEIRDALFNFSDHLPVSLLLQTNETLSTPNYTFNNSFKIIGSTIVRSKLNLQLDEHQQASTEFMIYNSFGQLIQSLKPKNSVYLEVDVSSWATGLYFIKDASNNLQPLKFIVSN